MRTLRAVLLCAAIYGCTDMPHEPLERCEDDVREVSVGFSVMTAHAAKSSLGLDDSGLTDINVYAYRDGRLMAETYSSDLSSVSLRLQVGCSYDIYALANVGEIHAGIDEREFSDTLVLRFDTVNDISEGVPMVWRQENVYVNDGMQPVAVNLIRTVSRVRLSLDKSLLEGFVVRSARVCQSPVAVRPFGIWDTGSRPESAEETADGDYASPGDLESLNSGGVVEFFTLENRQGNLLPDNRDPWLKVPDNLGERSFLCTYLELEGEFDEDYVLEGEVLYRFYLGLDNCSNFDVPANSTLYVRLCITDDALGKVSWQVEADASVRDGFVWGYVASGLHELDELYVGETVLYEVELSPQIQKLLKDSADRCSLAVYDGAGKSSCVGITRSGGDGECFQFEIKGLAPASGSLWLTGPQGEMLAELDRICVLPPHLVLSSSAHEGSGGYVPDLTSLKRAEINGDPVDVYVYLTDMYGTNLNTDAAYGFDPDMFDFSVTGISSVYGMASTVSCSVLGGEPCSGGYCAKVAVWCVNDGTDHELNSCLVSALQSAEAFSMQVSEGNLGLECGLAAGIDYLPVIVEYVDNGWAGYHDTQISAKVVNPSNLPLEVSCWQLDSSNDEWNAIARNEIVDYVEDNLDVLRTACVSTEYAKDRSFVYCSSSAFRCERNGYGSDAVEEGDVLIYPLEGISTEDIYKAQLYYKNGQESMCSLFDVTVDGVIAIPDDRLSLLDGLQDGSMKYSVIYGEEGWNDMGGWLYSSGMYLYNTSVSPFMDDYPSFTPENLDSFEEMYEAYGALDLHFRYSDGSLYVYASNADDYDVLLDFRFSGTVNGYVQTYPNGTWGAAKDNYCSATFEKTVKNVRPSTSASLTCADGGALKEAMDAVYANAFYDSKNWIGSSNNYQHHAHPVDMSFRMEVKISGTSPVRLCPVSFTWDSLSIGYYHLQEGVNYSCILAPAVSNYNVAVVSRQ